MATTRSDVPVQHASYDPGYGWVLFAGVLLMLLGTVNLIEGLAAVSNSAFFVRNAHYIIGSLNTWGWVVTIIGTFEFIAGFFVLVKAQPARWIGMLLLCLGTVIQLLLLPADPFWSLVVLALNIAALYGLAVHGAVATAPPRAPV
jgi:hypothetical protein